MASYEIRKGQDGWFEARFVKENFEDGDYSFLDYPFNKNELSEWQYEEVYGFPKQAA